MLNSRKRRSIESKVKTLLFSIGMCYPQNNIIEIATALGVQMVKSTMAREARGIIIAQSGKRPEIIINIHESVRPKGHLIDTLATAHMLAHFVLHKKLFDKKGFYIDYFNNVSEWDEEATYFAMRLLVPRKILQRLLKANIPTNDIAEYFAVSPRIIDILLGY